MKIKVCAVASCRRDSMKFPGLTFFSLPRDPNAKSEWLEALNLKHSDASANIKVCPEHFRPKDFCAGRRQLKTHALPVLNLDGVKKTEPLDSDDEFMMCDSDDDVLKEVKKLSTVEAQMMDQKIKQEPIEENPPEPEPETGRRPSRRAAREAAKKIYNTVRNYGCTAETDDPEVIATSSQRISNTPRSTQRQRQRSYQNIKVPPPNIDLIMECHEELLSTVQAEALLQAQLQYNMVMKTLRNLKASPNVKLIILPPEDPPPILSSDDEDVSDEKIKPDDDSDVPDEKIKSDDEEMKPDDDSGEKNKLEDDSSDLKETGISGETSEKENGTVIPMKLSATVASPAQSILS